MKEFLCRTRIVSGPGALNVLKELGLRRLFLVTDPFFAQNGTAERVARAIGAEAFEIFDQVAPDPSVTLVARGVAAVQQFRPDGIAALGGGSAMDCAKGIRYFSELQIPFAAIPTTSGSGSEVTDFAILTHEGVKHPLVDPSLRPGLAILDETLVAGLPPAQVADGGFDVLSHTLESWVGKNAGGFSDALALGAFSTVFHGLVESYKGDQSRRSAIHEASCMAGLAFTQAGLGLCHALSHALGGQFHVPHGRLNAILLPAVISCNEAAHARYADLARRAGLGGSSDTMALRNLKNGLIRLRAQLEMPENLAQAGILPTKLRENTEMIVTAALHDPCCRTNPQPVTEEMVRRVLTEVAGRG